MCIRDRACRAQVIGETKGLAQILDVELEMNMLLMMLDWCTYKDIGRIAAWLDAHMLGVFVKARSPLPALLYSALPMQALDPPQAVLRVVSYVDVVKEVLLGLGEYETHNRLDHHTDLLLGGLVTNESLYLRIGAGR